MVDERDIRNKKLKNMNLAVLLLFVAHKKKEMDPDISLKQLG